MSVTSNTSSGKRKKSGNGNKFYAVRVGRIPGIYHSWNDCNAQVQGTQNDYKSFPTLAEAEAFMRGAGNSTAKTSKANKFYGVAIGHVPGVYTDYAHVQAQISGYSSGKQQVFTTREEAQAFVNDHRRDGSAPISLRGDISEASTGKGSRAVEHPSKKQKKSDMTAHPLTNGDIKLEPGTGPLPLDAVDDFDPTIKLDPDTGHIRIKTEAELSETKLQPTGDFSGPIHVYTDGSSLGNGRVGAVGGVGVYFGPNDERNISEPLRGNRQTNQRAELTAVARALDHVPIDRSVLIFTDSNYSIQCLEKWFYKWEKNNWKSSSGNSVENKDLIEPILARIRERKKCRADTNFKWIKGHANDPGNVQADLLAVQGSRNSTPALRLEDVTGISSTLNALAPDYDGATDFDTLFDDIDVDGPPTLNQVPSPFEDHQLSKADASEDRSRYTESSNSQPAPLKTEGVDAMDIVREKVEEP
ncbi:ribonuclease H-like protein [Ophiobolus disseminans]|uniref:ribonuclease H n=1 Tax=Ophiobolus disseminans TaxID=1469910 RepID=A0A6A6ZED6_9PLEO|nr:ribonuclease H-like protein [Ophiobolus disseminans]